MVGQELLRWARMHLRPAEDTAGASLIEYALLLALIAIVCVGAVSLVGSNTANTLSEAGSMLP